MAMNTVPLAIPPDLLEEVRRTSEEVHLSSADVMRRAIKAGLPKVRESMGQLTPITNVPPLTDRTLDRLYRNRPADDGVSGISELIAGQAFHGEE